MASPWWLRPDRSDTVSLPRHRAAPGTSTRAPQWANKSKPTMHSSLMLASQNSWRVWLIPTTTDNSFFPGITLLSPVTVSSSVLVGVQSSGKGPAVPDNSPFRSKHMVDPVSTRALQGCPPTTQSRYSPLASLQRPTIGQFWWRGVKERGEGPLTASLHGRFPAVTHSGAGGSEQGSPWQSAPVLRSESSGLIWTSIRGVTSGWTRLTSSSSGWIPSASRSAALISWRWSGDHAALQGTSRRGPEVRDPPGRGPNESLSPRGSIHRGEQPGQPMPGRAPGVSNCCIVAAWQVIV